MPIPSYPENRREEYLNNIATGSGEIPPYPENREEQYLDAIARNGGGGGGSGGGVLVVHDVEGTLDKTWQEIHDSNLPVIVFDLADNERYFCVVTAVTEDVTGFHVDYYDMYSTQTVSYTATSADGYPVMQQGEG